MEEINNVCYEIRCVMRPCIYVLKLRLELGLVMLFNSTCKLLLLSYPIHSIEL